MELKQLSDRIYYYPHQPKTDRPMLAYIHGSKFNIAIDAGNSAAHIDEFYNVLQANSLPKPDFTIITHWHWDHTFGMHHINGLSIAHEKTNCFLREEMVNLASNEYIRLLKQEDENIRKEYVDGKDIKVVLSNIQFVDKLTLFPGGMMVQVFQTISPHSEDTTLIYIPEEKILFLGDATSEDFFNNNYMDMKKLKSLIETIEETDCLYCILSHAEPLKKTELLNYLYSVLC